MTDQLNDILIECCQLRGVYPLMHRTLHEFDWFCSAVIWGSSDRLKHRIAEAEDAGGETIASMYRDIQAAEDSIRERFKKTHFDYADGLELIRLAEAFRIYCRERYAGEAES